MKERPILFNGEMVRAILEGRKTQTRRVIKPQPDPLDEEFWFVDGYGWWGVCRKNPETGHPSRGDVFQCPYGQPGDRLWVRETFIIEHNYNLGDYDPPFQDGRPVKYHDADIDTDPYWEQPHYRATDPKPDFYLDGDEDPGCQWKPSIHMPRGASRITLEITDVRVERVQDISEDDARAEGLQDWYSKANVKSLAPYMLNMDRFHDAWDSINAKRGHSWDSNPWVWAISFKAKDK